MTHTIIQQKSNDSLHLLRFGRLKTDLKTQNHLQQNELLQPHATGVQPPLLHKSLVLLLFFFPVFSFFCFLHLLFKELGTRTLIGQFLGSWALFSYDKCPVGPPPGDPIGTPGGIVQQCRQQKEFNCDFHFCSRVIFYSSSIRLKSSISASS